MFNWLVTMRIIALIAMLGILSYIFFTRQTTNFFMKILGKYRKRYVVCHMRYDSGKQEDFLVIPNLQGLTKVGEYLYDLSDKYILLKIKNRKHFLLDENNVIPRYFDEIESKETILFQASEIKTAFVNTVMEYLFSKKKEILIYGLFIVAIAAILTSVYVIYELSNQKEILMYLVSKT